MRAFKVALLTIIFIMVLRTDASAHKFVIDPIEQGVIKVSYEDGKISEDTLLTLYDVNREQLAQVQINQDGTFHYDDYPEVFYIVADDGMGHRVQWQVGQPIRYNSGIWKWIKVAAIAAIFIVIALYFQQRKKKQFINKQ